MSSCPQKCEHTTHTATGISTVNMIIHVEEDKIIEASITFPAEARPALVWVGIGPRRGSQPHSAKRPQLSATPMFTILPNPHLGLKRNQSRAHAGQGASDVEIRGSTVLRRQGGGGAEVAVVKLGFTHEHLEKGGSRTFHAL